MVNTYKNCGFDMKPSHMGNDFYVIFQMVKAFPPPSAKLHEIYYMTELEQKPQGQTSPEAAQATAAASQAQAQTAQNAASAQEKIQPQADCPPPTLLKESPMSKGEKLYNSVLYKGVNYWLNIAISMYVTDLFTHDAKSPGKMRARCKNFFDNHVETWTKGLTKVGLPEGTARWFSKIALSTFTLNSGGNILLIPTKYAEDNKRKIVHWMNEHIYHDAQTAPDGHKLTPDEIYIEQEQPKQSWGRMIVRRLKGWGATTSVGLAMDLGLARKVAGADGKTVTKMGQEVYTEASAKAATTVLDVIPGAKSVTGNEAFQRYLGYASLDWIYTWITSTILHRTNGAGKGKAPKEIGDDFELPIKPHSVDDLEIDKSVVQADALSKIAKRDAESFKSKERGSLRRAITPDAIRDHDPSLSLTPGV